MKDKTILKMIYVVSGLVFLVVIVLNNLPKAESIPAFVKYLPKLNASINFCCALLLLTSFCFIKNGKIKIHKTLNIITFILSSVFLLSYITFHLFVEETKFPTDNPIRPLYLVILISHIILAAVVLPLVLLSFYRGLKGQIAEHKKLTRWSFPIWLYVSCTGVVIYLMISPYYNF